ncbi:ribonuclease H, partial [Trifolium pratense]
SALDVVSNVEALDVVSNVEAFYPTSCLNICFSKMRPTQFSNTINGTQQGYFKCSRGVRQGDPLSPLLFCIAEEVLSRGITRLVDDGQLDLIRGTRSCQVPSHSLYADDVMIYCSGKLSGLEALRMLFTRYAISSGQVIDAAKSTIFAGSISQARLGHIANLFGFTIGTFPFVHLGIPIFSGKPKNIYLQPIDDKVRAKLSAWKASLLSIAGRIQLVKSVIQSMLIYSLQI